MTRRDPERSFPERLEPWFTLAIIVSMLLLSSALLVIVACKAWLECARLGP